MPISAVDIAELLDLPSLRINFTSINVILTSTVAII